MSKTSDDIDAAGVLAHTKALEGRVNGIERAVGSLSDRLNSGLGDVGKQLADISTKIAAQQARPEFNVRELLSVVVACVALFAAAAGGITTLATYVAAAPQARTDERVLALQARMDRWDRAVDRAMDRYLSELRK